MEGNLAIFAMIWWVFAIINIVYCVKTSRRYKKLGQKGAAKRIIFSWLIVFGGIIAGSVIATAADSRDAMTTATLTFCTSYLVAIIAIVYVNSGARDANDSGTDETAGETP